MTKPLNDVSGTYLDSLSEFWQRVRRCTGLGLPSACAALVGVMNLVWLAQGRSGSGSEYRILDIVMRSVVAQVAIVFVIPIQLFRMRSFDPKILFSAKMWERRMAVAAHGAAHQAQALAHGAEFLAHGAESLAQGAARTVQAGTPMASRGGRAGRPTARVGPAPPDGKGSSDAEAAVRPPTPPSLLFGRGTADLLFRRDTAEIPPTPREAGLLLRRATAHLRLAAAMSNGPHVITSNTPASKGEGPREGLEALTLRLAEATWDEAELLEQAALKIQCNFRARAGRRLVVQRLALHKEQASKRLSPHKPCDVLTCMLACLLAIFCSLFSAFCWLTCSLACCVLAYDRSLLADEQLLNFHLPIFLAAVVHYVGTEVVDQWLRDRGAVHNQHPCHHPCSLPTTPYCLPNTPWVLRQATLDYDTRATIYLMKWALPSGRSHHMPHAFTPRIACIHRWVFLVPGIVVILVDVNKLQPPRYSITHCIFMVAVLYILPFEAVGLDALLWERLSVGLEGAFNITHGENILDDVAARQDHFAIDYLLPLTVMCLHFVIFGVVTSSVEVNLQLLATKNVLPHLLFPLQFFEMAFVYTFFTLRTYAKTGIDGVWVVSQILLQGLIIFRNSSYQDAFINRIVTPIALLPLRYWKQHVKKEYDWEPPEDEYDDPIFTLEFFAQKAVQYEIANSASLITTHLGAALFIWRDGYFTIASTGVLLRECDVPLLLARFAILIVIKPGAMYLARMLLKRSMRKVMLGKPSMHGVSKLALQERQRRQLNAERRRAAEERRAAGGVSEESHTNLGGISEESLAPSLQKEASTAEDRRAQKARDAQIRQSVRSLNFTVVVHKVMKHKWFFACVVTFQLFAVFPIRSQVADPAQAKERAAAISEAHTFEDWLVEARRARNYACRETEVSCTDLPPFFYWTYVDAEDEFGVEPSLRIAYWLSRRHRTEDGTSSWLGPPARVRVTGNRNGTAVGTHVGTHVGCRVRGFQDMGDYFGFDAAVNTFAAEMAAANVTRVDLMDHVWAEPLRSSNVTSSQLRAEGGYFASSPITRG